MSFGIKHKAFLALAMVSISSITLVGSVPIATLAQVENYGNTGGYGDQTTLGNENNTSYALGLSFSRKPIWVEKTQTTSTTELNASHTLVLFNGQGNMTVPDSAKKVTATSEGNAIVSGQNPVFAYGREHITSVEDGDKTAITYYKILQYNQTTNVGKGIVIAVFDSNATGTLEPFNEMMVIGTHEDNPSDSEQAETMTLWKWQEGISNTTASTMNE
jgi:hypothetical protein